MVVEDKNQWYFNDAFIVRLISIFSQDVMIYQFILRFFVTGGGGVFGYFVTDI